MANAETVDLNTTLDQKDVKVLMDYTKRYRSVNAATLVGEARREFIECLNPDNIRMVTMTREKLMKLRTRLNTLTGV